MTTFANTLKAAANHQLEDGPYETGHTGRTRYSCVAIHFEERKHKLDISGPCELWYAANAFGDLDIDCVPSLIRSSCGDEAQNVRFMLLMFMSYLAKDSGL